MNLQTLLVAAHRKWLAGFNSQHLKSWDDQFIENPESALCEAAVRDVMQGFGSTVEPFADLKGQREKGAVPASRLSLRSNRAGALLRRSGEDLYRQGNRTHEASAPRATRNRPPGSAGKLTKAVFAKATRKAPQCEQDLPTLLAVGTFHTAASRHAMDRFCANSLLTVPYRSPARRRSESIWRIGRWKTHQSTKLKYASFIKPGDCSIVNARTSISGILLCGFGVFPASIIWSASPRGRPALQPGTLALESRLAKLGSTTKNINSERLGRTRS